MAMFKDYYLILGIASNTPPADIEKIIQERKKDLSNKLGKDWIYSQDNMDLKEASEILLNPSNKAIYDQELESYNISDNIDEYEIKNERLAHVLNYVQDNIKRGATYSAKQKTSTAEKIGKGCAFVILILIAIMFKTCIGAVMKEKGKQDVRNKYSYVIESKTERYV